MSSHWCEVCGHINRVGSEVCAMCDSRLSADGAPHEGGPRFAPHAAEPPREGALPTDIPVPIFHSAGDVISPTLDVYRRNFPLVGALVLLTSLPLIALQYGAHLLLAGETSEFVSVGAGPGFFSALAGGTLLFWLLTMVANAMLAGSLAYAVVEIRRTGRAGLVESLAWGLRKLPKVIMVQLLYALMIYGIGGFLVAVSGVILGHALMVLFLIMLLAPFIILTLMFSLIVPAATVENRSPVDSFVRSAELTRGNKGLIFLTYFIWGVVVFVAGLIVNASFAAGGGEVSASGLVLQSLINQMLNSTTAVLTVFIFLGIVNENRQAFAARVVTPPAPAAEPAAR